MLAYMMKDLKTQTPDIGQIILSNSVKSLLLKSHNFDLDEFRDLLVEAIIKHNLPFSFVKYEEIRALFRYISKDIKYHLKIL